MSYDQSSHIFQSLLILTAILLLIVVSATEGAKLDHKAAAGQHHLDHSASSRLQLVESSASSASGEPEPFLRRQRDLAKLTAPDASAESEAQTSCTIRVKKVESVPGKCVKLKGGYIGCQTDRYLDPANEDCEE